MNIRKSLLAMSCVLALGAIAAPLTANAAVSIYLNFAPPMDHYEEVPPPRVGYEWSIGYWDIQDHQQAWQPGHWERVRTGYRFAQPRWVKYDTRWKLERGHWKTNQHHHSDSHHHKHGHDHGKSKNH